MFLNLKFTAVDPRCINKRSSNYRAAEAGKKSDDEKVSATCHEQMKLGTIYALVKIATVIRRNSTAGKDSGLNVNLVAISRDKPVPERLFEGLDS